MRVFGPRQTDTPPLSSARMLNLKHRARAFTSGQGLEEPVSLTGDKCMKSSAKVAISQFCGGIPSSNSTALHTTPPPLLHGVTRTFTVGHTTRVPRHYTTPSHTSVMVGAQDSSVRTTLKLALFRRLPDHSASRFLWRKFSGPSSRRKKTRENTYGPQQNRGRIIELLPLADVEAELLAVLDRQSAQVVL